MYGLIGQLLCVPDKRDALIEILLSGTQHMPGCLSYVVSRDTTDPAALWVTEIWVNKDAHSASLQLPSVRQAITIGRPMITGFGERHEIEPIGGYGLEAPAAS